MNTQLFIPNKVKVGFQKRQDTYTGNLGYVIYYDNKGVLRKETSWEDWRDDKIDPLELENVPTTGFVLNKKAGGDRGHSWEQRQTYSRVYDPRGFEFEITIPNLLFILQECDCSKGKGLEGEFVYAWEGKDLVLLPVSSDEYQKSIEHTKLLDLKVSTKDLKEGCVYKNSREEEYVYIGKYQFADRRYGWNLEQSLSEKKQFIFVPLQNVDDDDDIIGNYHAVSSLSTFKKQMTETPVDNTSTLIQNFLESIYSSKFHRYDYLPLEDKDLEYYKTRNWSSFDIYNKETSTKVRIECSKSIFYKIPVVKILRSLYYNNDACERYDYENKTIITEEELKNNFLGMYAIFENNSKIKTF